MYAHHALHLCRIRVRHRQAPAGDAGVVDQDTNSTQLRTDFRYHGAGLVQIINRGLECLCSAAQCRYLRRGLGCRCFVTAIIHRDISAILGKGHGDGPTNTPACSRDKSDASVQRHPIPRIFRWFDCEATYQPPRQLSRAVELSAVGWRRYARIFQALHHRSLAMAKFRLLIERLCLNLGAQVLGAGLSKLLPDEGILSC